MKEIKFRAYNKIEDSMSETFSIGMLINNFCNEYNYSEMHETDLFKLSNDDHVIMQYTGLKDKNGKEIYEGDIVEWHPDYDKYSGGKAIIIFDNESFIASVKDTGSDGFYGYDGREFSWENLEVIGNIYQNPELLTPAQSAGDKEE